MGYLTIERYELPSKAKHIWLWLMLFILLVVPIMIMMTWAVYRSHDLMIAQVVDEEEFYELNRQERITVRD